MARSTWEQKFEQRLALRPEMPTSYRLVSDWLCNLMQRHGYKNFGQVSQHFLRCSMECLPQERWGAVKCPTISILGSWFRAESGVKQDWVDSIAYVRRVEEGLPATFSGDDVLLWIRNAPGDARATPSDPGGEMPEPTGEAIVLTDEQISTWTQEQTIAVMRAGLAHLERLAAANGKPVADHGGKGKK
jgi:hypothetical protein